VPVPEVPAAGLLHQIPAQRAHMPDLRGGGGFSRLNERGKPRLPAKVLTPSQGRQGRQRPDVPAVRLLDDAGKLRDGLQIQNTRRGDNPLLHQRDKIRPSSERAARFVQNLNRFLN
jgi:hypothetical protein